MSGHFINFYLLYNNHVIGDAKRQALAIIAAAQQSIDSGATGVAITYSANYDQTVMIHQIYDAGGWNTHTGGGHQAEVMTEMESLLGGQYTSLQRKLEIAPITTMTYSNYGGETQEQVVASDLKYIQDLLDKGWDILGWQNQDSKPQARYAIGGSISGKLPAEVDTLIQTTLTQYATNYPPVATTHAAVVASNSLPTPKSDSVTIRGNQFHLMAFYFPDHFTDWDKHFQAPFLGNFWPCSITITVDSVAGTFQNAEAAFQATKWWKHDDIRQQLEGAKTGDAAFKIKNHLSIPADFGYCGLGREGAMETVLRAKFNQPDFKAALLATGDAYLLEHNSTKGRDAFWSDDHDGLDEQLKPIDRPQMDKGGKPLTPFKINVLGETLMQFRQHFGGAAAPEGDYTAADFSAYLLGGLPHKS